MVTPEGRAAQRRRSQVGHPGFLHRLRQAEIDAVDHECGNEPGHRRPGGKDQVDAGVDRPARQHHGPPPQPVGQSPADVGGGHLDHMVERPEHRHPCLGHARLRQPEQQEGVGRVAQREHQHGQQVPVEGAPEAVPVAAHVPARRRRRRAPRRLPDSRDKGCQHRHAGDRREEEHLSELEPGTHEERRGRERPHHGAGVVHGAVEAEGGAADLRGGHVGDERVAGRGADALPHPVGETQRQHRRPGAGQADERPGH